MKNSKINHYTVCTPQFTHYYSFYDMEPPEIVSDCVTVEAYTKKEAKVKAVREMRRLGMEWVLDQQSNKASPFTGLEVFPGECEHGNCWCDICTYKEEWVECPECLKVWEEEDSKT